MKIRLHICDVSFLLNVKNYILDNMNVTLQVWDIGGQSIGGKMLDKYIYGSNVSNFLNII